MSIEEGQFTPDEHDVKILNLLQKDGRISIAAIARKVFYTSPLIHSRLGKYSKEGVIEGYYTRLNKEKLGFEYFGVVFANLVSHTDEEFEEFARAVNENNQILECYHLTGKNQIFMTFVAVDSDGFRKFLDEDLPQLPLIEVFSQEMVLNTIKSTTVLPLGMLNKEE